jgi:hypothetical protein
MDALKSFNTHIYDDLQLILKFIRKQKPTKGKFCTVFPAQFVPVSVFIMKCAMQALTTTHDNTGDRRRRKFETKKLPIESTFFLYPYFCIYSISKPIRIALMELTDSYTKNNMLKLLTKNSKECNKAKIIL